MIARDRFIEILMNEGYRQEVAEKIWSTLEGKGWMKALTEDFVRRACHPNRRKYPDDRRHLKKYVGRVEE